MRKWKVICSRRIPTSVAVAFCLLSVQGYSAEQVAPRFPETVLVSPGKALSNTLSGQGLVMVAGRLLISPCVLSDRIEEIQGKGRTAGDVMQVTVALEGCGNGQVESSLRREVAVTAIGVWGGEQGPFQMRLNNGVNYLTLPVSRIHGLIPLEVTYE